MKCEQITQNLVVYRGTTPQYELRVTKNGSAVDITGWTVFLTVKEKMSDDDNAAIIKKDITSHLDATGGKSLIELTTTDTNRVGSFYYDIKIKTDDGQVFLVVRGRMNFEATATQRG